MSNAAVPRPPKSRTVGVVYLLYFLTAMSTAAVGSRPHLVLALNLISVAFYVALAVLFYKLFKSVNQGLSLIAALVSLAGCIVQVLALFSLTHINPLVFFGPYCVLIGYLVVRCAFLPHILGALLMLAGVVWVLLLLPVFARHLLAPAEGLGILAEGLLMLWLLIFGVRVPPSEKLAEPLKP